MRKNRERLALGALLLATAVLYLWGLGASGWANAFYSAAVQAGATSWKAFFYGSFDAASFITVDKTPASLWVMGLSARLFGVTAWSILVPQALEGVAAVGVLYATVKRWFGASAALIAGAAMAVLPVATLMFRFNNPDALLTLLLVLAAYAVTRAIEKAGTAWLLLAGAFVGFGFLTKMLQALLIVPALGLSYLVAAPARPWRRIWQLLAATGVMVAAGGWWVAIVSLVPASQRPYIGGSQTNSILELTLGYNGLGRITGDETGSVGGGANGGNWGQTGITRLFDGEIGGQIAWLLPAALILMVACFVFSARAPRTSRTRAALLLWGGWLVVTGLVFSFMAGIFHAYYTVALAPAVGALVGIGSAALYAHRQTAAARAILAVTVGVTALSSFVLFGRSAAFLPWLRPAVLVAGLLAAVAILAPRFVRLAAPLALLAAFAGPAAYSVDTASVAHTGSIPVAGPAITGTPTGPGGFGNRTGAGGRTRMQPPGGFGALAGGPPSAGGGAPGGGGLLTASQPSEELVALLKSGADGYVWAAAAVGSQNAAGYQLAGGEPVMSLGGFNGSDPSISLAGFQKLVAGRKVHYFLGGGGGFGGGRGGFGQSMGGSQSAQEIASWVAENYTARTIGGAIVYDLSQ